MKEIKVKEFDIETKTKFGDTYTTTDGSGMTYAHTSPSQEYYVIEFIPFALDNFRFNDRLGVDGLLFECYQSEPRYLYFKNGIYVTDYTMTMDKTSIIGKFQEEPKFYKNKNELTKE